ncbi:MAG: efflux RND transporter periplasmic adaptor subunit [Proteobacteria bacterium]|nr:efflux RND transporter periplasmic adaptor subunit [Pseudomonadota bacterium]
MAFWKQLFLSLVLLCGALWGAALWVPGAAGLLRSWGLGPVMDQVGIPAEAAEPAAPAAGRPRGAGGGAVVRAEPPGEGRVADTVAAIGDGRALRSVTLYPQTPGHVAEVLVQSGQRVEAGAVILRLDSEAEEIGLERARLVLDDARTRRDRVQQLRGSGAATDVQIREAELAVRQAELGLRQAEFDLTQRTLLAPINGWLGILNVEPGTQVGTQTEIAQIDDRSALLVDFRLPESMVGRVALGDAVEAEILAGGQGRVTGHVSAIDNRVDAASRTLRVQARLENAEDRLRAGMAFSIRIALPGSPAASVDPLAVQWSREGAFVWVVREGVATRLPIAILQRADQAVMVEADFQPGDLVIVEGVQSVRPGAPVTLQGEG